MHPVKEELIDSALSEKAAAYPQWVPVCFCHPAIPVVPAERPGSWPAGERMQLDCSSGLFSDLL